MDASANASNSVGWITVISVIVFNEDNNIIKEIVWYSITWDVSYIQWYWFADTSEESSCSVTGTHSECDDILEDAVVHDTIF